MSIFALLSCGGAALDGEAGASEGQLHGNGDSASGGGHDTIDTGGGERAALLSSFAIGSVSVQASNGGRHAGWFFAGEESFP